MYAPTELSPRRVTRWRRVHGHVWRGATGRRVSTWTSGVSTLRVSVPTAPSWTKTGSVWWNVAVGWTMVPSSPMASSIHQKERSAENGRLMVTTSHGIGLPHYWPFERGIHNSLVDFPSQWVRDAEIRYLTVVIWGKLLNKHSNFWWSETPWYSCDNI